VRRLPPGSEWLYVKAYCGPAAADAVLRDAVAPALAGERWFFVRYGDPEWHVRVRVTGDPDRLAASVEPRITAALAPFLRDGRLWRVQLDTYEREVERYGGDEGMVLAEELFYADSVAVAAIVALLEGSEAADARWRLALVGTHLLLDDLGYTVEDSATWARRRRDGFFSEFPGAARLPKQLGQRFREERADLETLLWGDASDHWLAPGLAALHDRSLALRPIGHRLRELAGDRRLDVSVDSWTASVAHMHANRLLRSSARAQELVIHDLLDRLYRGRLARARR
jgi:thiopeptide-type bacteriocin biosynthesis protein